MITILHTNDFHNRLTEEKAAVLKRARNRLGGRGVLIDAGDAVGSGNISYRGSGEPILDVMNAIGYDGMAVGNREFHLTRRGFQCKVGRARFPVLCANVRERAVMESAKDPYTLVETTEGDDTIQASGYLVGDTLSASKRSDTMPRLPVVDFLVRTIHVQTIQRTIDNDAEPLSVLIFTVTVPMITGTMVERHISHYLFEHPVVVSSRIVPLLKQRYRPHLTVALTHIGIDQDRQLAESVPGIDLIVGGHSHTVLPDGERVGETLIVHAGSHARFVGRVDVSSISKGRLCMQASLTDLSSLASSKEAETRFLQSLDQ